ncbi:hypothetical protein BB560_004141 [Smittium megazygosporum]|uniref:Endonuclease/exonuclease/phosphatase domain-containing protein n=1 Tax=Smittium megazygosporum TaxID=133381 RepID=A0A2T9ZA81_9FUNG|nr:hypothetical protein BB560_004141 [Smittium megazygosporum]
MLCSTLKMNGIFVAEFIEHESPLRTDDLQVCVYFYGLSYMLKYQGGGVHGNAILSKFDMVGSVDSHDTQPYNWDRDGDKLGEPRNGARYILSAKIKPWMDKPEVLVYNTHFECFTGVSGRIGQFSDLVQMSFKEKESFPHQLVFGDMNTFAHSIARLSPKYCCDMYRFRSIFLSEPEFWYLKIFGKNGLLKQNKTEEYTLYEKTLHLYDPYDPISDYTIENHMGLMKAKVDWTFVSGFNVNSFCTLNDHFLFSDHKLLCLDLTLGDPKTCAQKHRIQVEQRYNSVRNRYHSKVAIALATVCGLASLFFKSASSS